MDNAVHERCLDSLDRLHQLHNAIRDIVVPMLRSVGVAGIVNVRAARHFLTGSKSLAAEAKKELSETPCLLISEEAQKLELRRARRPL